MALFTKFSSWLAGKTLKREFAAAALLVWIAVTIRMFFGLDSADAAVQAVNYGTATSTVWLYIAAAVGLQQWANAQPGKDKDKDV